MSDSTPPPGTSGADDASDAPGPDASRPGSSEPADASPTSAEGGRAARRRAAHRAPAKPTRIIVPAVLALAALAALLVAFNSCSDPFDEGAGLVTPVGGPTITAPITPSPLVTSTGSPSPTATGPTPIATTRTPTPTPTSTRTTAPPTTAPPTSLAPKIPVTVLNGTAIRGLASDYAAVVRRAGWTVAATGNWRRTEVGATTVYYATGDEASARRLAADLPGGQVVRPVLPGMSSRTLTVVVVR